MKEGMVVLDWTVIEEVSVNGSNRANESSGTDWNNN